MKIKDVLENIDHTIFALDFIDPIDEETSELCSETYYKLKECRDRLKRVGLERDKR